MRTSFVALALLALLATAHGAHISSVGVQKFAPTHSLEFSFCGICTQLISQSFSNLLNAALNVGVVGGCGELCGKAFPSKQTDQKVCNLLCDGAGIYTFVKLLDKFHDRIDPIYFCELLHSCPVVDGGKVALDSLVVTPSEGRVGSTFEISAAFTVANATGTGELIVDVIPPRDMPFGDGQLYTGFAPGQYGVKFNLRAEPSEDESFGPGVYKVQFALCEGECGSPYPHSALLTSGVANFTITA